MERYKTIHENKVMINPPEEVKRLKQTPYQRIKKVMNFYYNRGVNSEKVNNVYRNIVKQCKYCGQVKGKHKLSCGTQKVVITL